MGDQLDQWAAEYEARHKQQPQQAAPAAPMVPSAGGGDAVDDFVRRQQQQQAVPATGGDAVDDFVRRMQGGKPAAQKAPAEAFAEPEGSAISRFGQGLWSTTGAGLKQSADAIADLLNYASGQKKDLDPNTKELGKALIQAHKDQYNKMQDAWNRGDTWEAIGHAMGMMPLVGPAAAHAGEVMGGEAPVYDRYGNVIMQGQAPDIARGLGEGIGLIIPSAAKAAGVKIPLVPKFNRATPEVQAAMRSLTDFGATEAENIAPNAAASTGSPYIKHAQKLAQSTPVGAWIGESADEATTKALQTRAARLEQQAAPQAGKPYSVTPLTSGESLQKAIENKIAQHGIEANQHYDAWRSGAADPVYTQKVQTGVDTQDIWTVDPNTGRSIWSTQTVPRMEDVQLPVDIRGVKASLRPIVSEIDGWIKDAQMETNQGYLAAKRLLGEKDFIPATDAEPALGAIKRLADKAPEGRGKGLAKFVVPQLQDAIENSVKQAGVNPQGINLLYELGEGRKSTVAKYAAKDVLDALNEEPVGAFRQATLAGDANINLLRDLDIQAPGQMRTLGRAWLQNLFKLATEEGGFNVKRGARYWNEWQKLGPETRKLLFDPKLADELHNFFLGVKTLAENPNPSGTAIGAGVGGGLVAAATAPHVGLPVMLGGAALTKLFRSAAGVRLLTQGMKMPLTAPGASHLVLQVMRMAGIPEAEKRIPPAEEQARGGIIGRNPNRADVLRSLGA